MAYTRMTAWGFIGLIVAKLVATQSNEIGHTNFSTWYPITEFPDAQQDNVSYWQAEAVKVAGADLWYDMSYRCILASSKYPEVGSGLAPDLFVAPGKAFDNLYFVGTSTVSVWALDTGSGLILIDALWNPDEAERIIVPGVEALGFKPTDIKALIITHEHIDHFGGAGWLQTNFGIPVYASAAAWDALAAIDGAPAKEHTIEDGDKVTLGNVSVTAYVTPGHTPGTVSMLLPVRENGVAHLAGLYGGNGIPRSPEDKATQIESYRRFAQIAEDAGVDVLLGNHQTHDRSLQNLDVLANRRCDGDVCSLPNPYIVGTDRYVRFLKTMEICVRVKAARANEYLRI